MMPKLRKNHSQYALAAFAIALLFPSIACANGVTALMMLEMSHILFLNLVIGFGEGLIIAFIFKTSKIRTIGIMVLANYFSTWIGYMGIWTQLPRIDQFILADEPLYNATKFIAIIIVIAFIMTLLLEWPFCLWALRQKPHRIRNSFFASLLVNTISYTFLLWPYCSASSFATYKQIAIDRDLSFSNSHKYWIYFLLPTEQSIYRIHPDGSAKEKIAQIDPAVSDRTSLVVLPSREPNTYDLWTNFPKGRVTPKFAVKTALAQYSRYHEDSEIIDEPNKINDVYYSNSHSYTDFRDPNQRAWKPSVYWPWQGFVFTTTSGKQLTIKFETPFLVWEIQNPIILPDDFVIFQLGGQIVLLDINNRKIRMITLGRGPVVTMD